MRAERIEERRRGDILLCRESTIPSFEAHWVKRLMATDVEDVLDKGIIDRVNSGYLKCLRGNL